MDNKLSELSKPVGFVVTGGTLYRDRALLNKSMAERYSADRNDGSEVEPLYSQEYVSALLARIAELERILDGVTSVMIAGGWTAKGISDYAKSLETKLATPVRLQSPWVDKVGNRWLLEGTTADVIRTAGFAVTVEVDE
ncbi:hypothetical protein [Serratia nematodiphila]|uniref:hypothetical protein n=1 Tax=Serratia nematodiphila TaxID=458197 RepID=UPI0011D7E53E|nr:hypothetical protein [Serratia nematodiphila]TXE64804.1 hypothetical protein FOT58_10735 [Serratia nematodiphila]